MPASRNPGGRGTPGRPNAHQYRRTGEATDIATELEDILGLADLGLAEGLYTGWKFYLQTLSDTSNTYTFTLTRADPATYVDSTGYLTEVAAGAARYEHPAGGGAALGLLHEDLQTNLYLYSEDANTGWTDSANCDSFNETTVVGMAGGNCRRVEAVAGGTNAALYQTVTVTASNYFCLSAYVKQGTSDGVAISGERQDNTRAWSRWDWVDGALVLDSSDADSEGAEEHVGGWWRVWQVFQNNAAAGGRNQAVYSHKNDATTDAGEYNYYCCMQFEQVPYADSKPTSWIPTTSASEDRARDDWNFPADKSFITAQGVCYMESTIQRAETDKYWLSTENGASTVLLRFQASSGTQITFRYDPTVAAARTDIAGTVSGGFSLEPTMQKTALSWDTGSGEIIPYAKGAACGTPGTNAAEMDSSLLTTGDLASVLGTKPPYRMIFRELRFYGESKTAAELATLTT